MSKQFDLIFADPPYEMGFVAKILKNKAILKSLGSDSLMILEHTLKEKIPDDIEMLDIYDQRQYGKTLISFFKQSS
ncbi:MAG: RsmD family RNA methyltransferase [Desulfamplus sp.]|nr:RsmD family RNA methyltransferase [Desulfamplus sp.]